MSSDATAGQTPDIYGQVHPVETPELLANKHVEFEQELQKILDGPVTDANRDLRTAMNQCPELLTTEFKLMFLRSDVFNADLAAYRFARYWKKRVEIVGRDKAFQPLTLDKALSEDKVALEIGYLRLLVGAFDERGRALLYMDPSLQDRTKYTRQSMARAMWYVIHAALEHESAQKHGVLMIGYPYKAKLSQLDRGLTKMVLTSIQGAIPVRMSGIHICHPPAFISIVLPFAKLFMQERLKKRIQVHTGSDEKVLNHLKTWGISKKMMPDDLGGDIVLDHIGWLAERRSKGL